jgi:large subunit ribosomal protein L23
MNAHEIIKRPLITEKMTGLREHNQVAFEVDRRAGKEAIKKAVEQLFKVTVAGVNTSIMRGKLKRVGRHSGYRANWKKAIVTLKEGQTIDFVEGV